jgi:hypothetical protein
MYADIYASVKDAYVPAQTVDVIEVFAASEYSMARVMASLLTRHWVTEQYSTQEWSRVAPIFAALLHDSNESVACKAREARRAFIGAASTEIEAYRRIYTVRRLRQPLFATTQKV